MRSLAWIRTEEGVDLISLLLWYCYARVVNWWEVGLWIRGDMGVVEVWWYAGEFEEVWE